MKMNSENTNFLITLFIVAGITLLLSTDINPQNRTNPYWIILALLLPQILKVFPKMREFGVGSSQFIPNLYSYFQNKLKHS